MDAQDRLKRQLVAAVTSTKHRVPDAGRLIWMWFTALHSTRHYGMAGATPIAYAEIAAYARINRLPIRADHIAILRAMDDAWLTTTRRRQEKIAPGMKPAPSVSDQEISAKSFDVMFG